MKRFLLALLIIPFLLCPATAQAGGVQINFEWDQSNIGPDFWGWKMWVGTSPGGPYDYLGRDANDQPISLFSVQYDPANPQGPFVGTGSILAPANAETTFYFVVNAWDSNGNFSPDSNEVSEIADFLGPDAPVLSVTSIIVISTPPPP